MHEEPITVTPADTADRSWIAATLTMRWGGIHVASRGTLHDASALPALIAFRGAQRCGLLTYRPDGDAVEIVSLDAFEPQSGIGTALLKELTDRFARSRIWLITTNDNLTALRFYQRRNFRMVAVHRDAVIESRKLKPGIPKTGEHGIPLRDEIEMEWAGPG